MRDLLQEHKTVYCKTFEETYCKKFSGALAVELIRHDLKRAGIPVSPRDVFIKGVDIEIDLVIPKRGARPKYNLVYRPEDVVAALEVKYRGVFDNQGIDRIRANFHRIQRSNRQIQCLYVTVTETKGYKGAVYSTKLGYPAYTLYWYSDRTKEHRASGDWVKLLNRLAQASGTIAS